MKQAGFVRRINTTTFLTTNYTASETTRYHLSNNRREQRTSHRGQFSFLTSESPGMACANQPVRCMWSARQKLAQRRIDAGRGAAAGQWRNGDPLMQPKPHEGLRLADRACDPVQQRHG